LGETKKRKKKEKKNINIFWVYLNLISVNSGNTEYCKWRCPGLH